MDDTFLTELQNFSDSLVEDSEVSFLDFLDYRLDYTMDAYDVYMAAIDAEVYASEMAFQAEMEAAEYEAHVEALASRSLITRTFAAIIALVF